MLNEISDRILAIQEKALAGDMVAVDCVLFWELAVGPGCSNAAAVIARDRFVQLYPEFRDVPDAPVVLPPPDDEQPDMTAVMSALMGPDKIAT